MPVDPNDHLQGVLTQLEKIANGTPTKLPRPFGGDFRTTAEQDFVMSMHYWLCIQREINHVDISVEFFVCCSTIMSLPKLGKAFVF